MSYINTIEFALEIISKDPELILDCFQFLYSYMSNNIELKF